MTRRQYFLRNVSTYPKSGNISSLQLELITHYNFMLLSGSDHYF